MTAESHGDALGPPPEGEDTGGADIAFCADGCRRPATDERLAAAGTDTAGGLIECVELVCAWHADHPEVDTSA